MTPSNFYSRILRSKALVYNSFFFFSEHRFYGNYSTLDSHTNTVISHAFTYTFKEGELRAENNLIIKKILASCCYLFIQQFIYSSAGRSNCGRKSVSEFSKFSRFKMVGGRISARESWPWQIAIYAIRESGKENNFYFIYLKQGKFKRVTIRKS